MRSLILSALAATLILAACGTDNSTDTTQSPTGAATTSKSELLNDPPKPGGMQFQRTTIGGASFDMPTGATWQQEGNSIYNPDWDMTIVVQSQTGDMHGMEKEYLDSYNDANLGDAPNWKRGPETLGEMGGKTAARTEGSYNNGTAYTTRDYVLFDRGKTVILQGRIATASAAHLAPTIDYIASTYQ